MAGLRSGGDGVFEEVIVEFAAVDAEDFMLGPMPALSAGEPGTTSTMAWSSPSLSMMRPRLKRRSIFLASLLRASSCLLGVAL